MSDFDVVVLGGGIVGATVALGLAMQTSLRIALLDATEHSMTWQENTYDHRVSALSPASVRILQQLRVWDAIVTKRVSPYHAMHVWDAKGKGSLDFRCREFDLNVLGYIVENSAIHASLLEKIAKTSIQVMSPYKGISLQKRLDYVELRSENEMTLQTKLVVGADGAHSWVRQQTGIDVSQHEYGHHAIVAMVQTAKSHQFTAWQRFMPTGPLAFLPLQNENLCSIVWSTTPEQAQYLLTLSDESFQEALTDAFENQLGDVVLKSQRYEFNLTMRHAKHYVQSNIALVGDAAHTIHPLAGQGMNLGLLDAACLIEVIVDSVTKHRHFSSFATLRRYERWRKSDNTMMLVFIDTIKRLFASEQRSFQQLRNMGLSITNQITFIKKCFANYAIGNRIDMPSLAKVM